MDSIYDMLRSLPLFKGISEETLSAFVERTKLHFNIYEKGDKIIDKKCKCNSVTSLLSGSIIAEHPVYSADLVVRERLDAGRVLGIEHLFGIDTHFNFNAKAAERSGTMEFSKAVYLKLLQSSSVCMMNYLNYLSLRAQNCETAMIGLRRENILSMFAFVVRNVTSRDAYDIEIECTSGPMEFFVKKGVSSRVIDLRDMVMDGLIEMKSERVMRIVSREALLEAAQLNRNSAY